MEAFNNLLSSINSVIWHEYVLYIVLGVGVLFTIWSGFGQYRALTHGVKVVRGVYDDKDDPGAINHFQALSAALSATVGLGNIGGVAVAIALGGPGAVFWMWMIGLAGMALKTTEVCLSLMYRNTEDPDNPHGGPMFVAAKGFKKKGLGGLGKVIGAIFVFTLLISAITGGNMFQAWNVAEVTEDALRIPTPLTGVILAVVVGLVIIGGIKRIGAVTGRLVPLMCAIYILAALTVLAMNIADIPAMLMLIVNSAFNTLEAEGAFVGGAWGYAFLWGMKRALFSSEAGQGSSPIAHSAAKTDEPAREAVVAGLEPFIDTIVVCTITSLVILSSGAWNRGGEAAFPADNAPVFAQVEGEANTWSLGTTPLPRRSEEARNITKSEWNIDSDGDLFVIAEWGDLRADSGDDREKVMGKVRVVTSDSDDVQDRLVVDWAPVVSDEQPVLVSNDIYKEYPGATLTSHAFDRVIPGFGTWLILIASWLFAISTLISWSYYGEQGIVFLFGDKAVLPYKLIYCVLALVACLGFIKTDAQLDNLTALGTGVMLWANIPIMLIFGSQAMSTFHDYFRRMKSEDDAHTPPSFTDVVEGHDVE